MIRPPISATLLLPMSERIRTPALTPPPICPAVPRGDDPSVFLEAHYRRVLAERMADLPFLNAALTVAAVGFQRVEGDWLGVVVTPWFLNLFLFSGGGSLWGDIPAGERRYVNLPCGTLQFIADDDPDLGPYQYAPLIAPVTAVPDMASALRTAREAMAAVLVAPAASPAAAEPGNPTAGAAAAVPPGSVTEAAPPTATGAADGQPSRRAFFRRLAGKR